MDRTTLNATTPPSGRTVLVTGAGGFIGSAVVRLLATSIETGDARFADGTPIRHVTALLRPGGSTARLGGLETTTCSVAHVDLTDPTTCREVVRRLRPRAILHVAVDGSVYRAGRELAADPRSFRPLEALVEGLAEVPDARFVHTGSAWVLRPGTGLDENAAVEPRSPYAVYKAAEDDAVARIARRTGVPFLNLRLFNVFGRHEQPFRLLPYLVRRLATGRPADLSHGEQVRDFNDVDSVATAYLGALAARDDACGRLYHVGSGHGTTVREFAGAVAEVTGNGDLVRFDRTATGDQDLPSLVADPTRAQQHLGWRADPDPRPSVQAAARWWLARQPRTTTKEFA